MERESCVFRRHRASNALLFLFFSFSTFIIIFVYSIISRVKRFLDPFLFSQLLSIGSATRNFIFIFQRNGIFPGNIRVEMDVLAPRLATGFVSALNFIRDENICVVFPRVGQLSASRWLTRHCFPPFLRSTVHTLRVKTSSRRLRIGIVRKRIRRKGYGLRTRGTSFDLCVSLQNFNIMNYTYLYTRVLNLSRVFYGRVKGRDSIAD